MALYKGFSTFNRSKKYRITDFELVKQDILNHFNIRKGEKMMNPEFGTIIWDSIFEPFTEQLKNQIIDDVTKIAKADPRLVVESIMVDSYDNGLILELRLVYARTNEVENLRLVFDKTASAVR